MAYVSFAVALGIVILFGYWSGQKRRKIQKKTKAQGTKIYPLQRKRDHLRRVK